MSDMSADSQTIRLVVPFPGGCLINKMQEGREDEGGSWVQMSNPCYLLYQSSQLHPMTECLN